MITDSEITKYFYKILNVSELTDIITGGIYRFNKPENSEKEDIVINTIFLKSGHYKDIQNGICNINCYCVNINGLRNISRLETIANKVIELLESYQQTNFSYEILETNSLKDLQQNSMSYINIRIQTHKY